MSRQSILVTGGAGFIGTHLVDALLADGHDVRVLDSLDPQVHPSGAPPPWLSSEAELVRADVRDRDRVSAALDGIDVIYHLAAAVGVGQSMYRVSEYVATNTQATADLLQALIERRGDVQRLVVASSMSIYGEGLYRGTDGRGVERVRRAAAQLEAKRWEPRATDGRPVHPVPTPEDKRLDPRSVYALTKADQEAMALQIGDAYGIPTVALRFFNVYGPRQALTNPYTGVMAIFSSRLLNGKPPLVYEDGQQRRDFVSVHDIVQALRLAKDSEAAVGCALNIGSGTSMTICEVAETLATALGRPLGPQITGDYRVGDIRHCFADTSAAARHLGYAPAVELQAGVAELVEWLAAQEPPEDTLDAHVAELAAYGLTQ